MKSVPVKAALTAPLPPPRFDLTARFIFTRLIGYTTLVNGEPGVLARAKTDFDCSAM
jgi:hypothetical protein